MSRRIVLVVLVAAFAAGFLIYAKVGKTPEAPLPEAALAPPQLPGAHLLEGLGDYHFAITTTQPEAQRWFNQGLMLAYGFNHDAAERSFLRATEIDPDCAMCWWGAALVLGPHVNATMDPANNGKAWMRIEKARALATGVTPREQGFIDALSQRYAAEPPADRRVLDEAYAAASGMLAASFPDDLDAATFHAEAMMDLQPWDYYDAQQRPKGNTGLIVKTLEGVMARMPDHAGALHLYIHAVEASADPDRGAAAADRLRELIPGSGHLLHMPAHIYTRVGRYHDAAVANIKAVEADDRYLAICRPAPGVYPLGYVPHNHHFLWWAASMEGASETALAAAQETARRAWNEELIKLPDFAFLQDYWITPLKARVQFGRWDEVLATPEPPGDLQYAQAIWNFAQGMAAVRQQRLDQAQTHLATLALRAAEPAMDTLLVGPKHALSGTLKVAERVLSGELAAARGDSGAAIAALREGVALEDRLEYFEPPLWHHPVRHTLGAVQLAAGKAAEAEKTYREDLKRHRKNGWSQRGLALSLRAQGKTAAADAVEQDLHDAWQHADVTPEGSRI
jgi:tetratricopeptide (TPR) repeat protein